MKAFAAVLTFVVCSSGYLSASSEDFSLSESRFALLPQAADGSKKQVSSFVIGYSTYTADWELKDRADENLWVGSMDVRQKQYYIGVSMDHEDVGFDARLGFTDMFGKELFASGEDFHIATNTIFFHVGLDVPVVNTNIFAIGLVFTYDYYPLMEDDDDISATLEETLKITNYNRWTFGVLFKKNPIDAPFRFEWGPMYYASSMKVTSEIKNRTTEAVISDFDTEYEEKGSAGLVAKASVVLSESVGFTFEFVTRSKISWSIGFDILF